MVLNTLNPSEYVNLFNNFNDIKSYQKDVCIYDLGISDDDYKEIMLFCHKELLSSTLIGTANSIKVRNSTKYINRPYIPPISAQEWLAYIFYSKYVITNSFHGVCFSILFKKQFCVILKDYKDARIIELLKSTGLLDRIIIDASAYNIKTILNTSINYNEVELKYKYNIENSKQWLNKALNDDKLCR